MCNIKHKGAKYINADKPGICISLKKIGHLKLWNMDKELQTCYEDSEVSGSNGYEDYESLSPAPFGRLRASLDLSLWQANHILERLNVAIEKVDGALETLDGHDGKKV